ncbi:hypothetical protein BVG16_31680 [Paenibacillus selenitireducens]|uniref:Methyltransferase domain-containing protein n=1 Tax=Paenibacillus selenitireducens TaxID=1324314 RepID=A0A1T2WZ24_9BACL|nr:class I SAM-dependent methyltransferase [Paenibacillus selenitireducens]OPA72879.1 hypothetical protein BVG16_31680 [Paenibacillus selenitireducens]
MSKVIQYYEAYTEEIRFTRNSSKIEFLTSVKALSPQISDASCILDVGAGTGAYSFYFAERGHQVTAIDITPRHIDAIRQQLASSPHELELEARLGDATNLCDIAAESYDVVLCMGPMYHLVEESQQRKCIEECLRVLKPGGILAVAYINKLSILPMLVNKEPDFVRESVVQKILQEGTIQSGEADCFWTDAHFATPSSITSLLTSYAVKEVDHLGTDGVSHTISRSVDVLSEEQFQAWLLYHEATCREPSILGLSTHGLFIGEKI